MLQTEIISENRIKYYSNADVMIRQIETGTLYEHAVHDLPCAFTYEETDIPVPDNEIDDAEAYSIITGGAI